MTQNDLNTLIGLAGVGLGGANLAFILRLLYNDLHELRQLLLQHLRDHAKQ